MEFYGWVLIAFALLVLVQSLVMIALHYGPWVKIPTQSSDGTVAAADGSKEAPGAGATPTMGSSGGAGLASGGGGFSLDIEGSMELQPYVAARPTPLGPLGGTQSPIAPASGSRATTPPLQQPPLPRSEPSTSAWRRGDEL